MIFQSKKTELILIILVSIVSIIVIYTVVVSIPTSNHSLEVDALKDPESLFTNSRVVLKNTGKLPLHDIVIIYDKNRTLTENLMIVNPGQTVILSPPQGAPLKSVQVITGEGINIEKEFRSPIKLPGMIGS